MKIVFNSPVILLFSLLCTLVLALNMSSADAFMYLFSVGNTIDTSNPIEYFRLFSHVLGHASIDHLIGNLTFILLLGPIIEEKYGSIKTLIMILVTAVITGILNILFFDTGLLGASGVVFMLILLVSFTNVRSGEIPITFILVALLFIGKEVWMSLGSDNVSQFAHIIGGICGSIFGFNSAKRTI